MRIALVHSFYAPDQPSGENDMVRAQASALQRAGHSVEIIGRYSKAGNPGLRRGVELGIQVASGRGDDPLAELESLNPDVVHVHNLFPNWGRNWVERWNGPIVSTLHNFRHSCAAGTFYRDGKPCTDCLHQTSLAGLAHRCYRDSAVATLPLTVSTRGGASRDRVLKRADAVVALSDRAAELHIESGVPRAKLAVIPNFVGPASPSKREDRSGWVYFGRLSQEKGVVELAEAWPPGQELRLFGAGPLAEQVAAINPAVRVTDLIPADQVPAVMARARGVVFPSRWAESAVPVVYLHALATGTPVIAWASSSAADDVLAGGSGLVLADWRGLTEAMSTIESRWEEYSGRGSARFAERYTEGHWVRSMESLYRSLL